MATCPQCGHYLGEAHRCHGMWRLTVRVWSHVLGGAAVGAMLAVGATWATRSAPSLIPVALCALTGGIVISAYGRGEPR